MSGLKVYIKLTTNKSVVRTLLSGYRLKAIPQVYVEEIYQSIDQFDGNSGFQNTELTIINGWRHWRGILNRSALRIPQFDVRERKMMKESSNNWETKGRKEKPTTLSKMVCFFGAFPWRVFGRFSSF